MKRTPILFLNVLVIATCGLIYELQAATLSSFVIGDSVTQFSLIIGLYLSALGVGAWLSRFLDKDLAYEILWTFVRTLSVRLRETNDKIKAFFALSARF